MKIKTKSVAKLHSRMNYWDMKDKETSRRFNKAHRKALKEESRNLKASF